MLELEASGFRGVVGPFGYVETFIEDPPRHQPATRQAHLRGAGFPETLFSGGAHSLPSLDGGWLKVDGTVADMELVVTGVRKGARWLQIDHRGRRYRYVSGGDWRDARLSRDGVGVSIRNGRDIPGVGWGRIGRAEGDVDATDLAIAIVLEMVDRSALSTLNALLGLPGHLLFGRTRDGGAV
ncbi:hypothetical protein [Streptomyces sp. NPDC091268]|uniref:hypothetical protein n=1 Tax=Streptomyces sp. NPDC091268 TaxID=3365979 RepID=UPI00380F67D9